MTLIEFENQIQDYLDNKLLADGTYNPTRHKVTYDFAEHRLNFMAACYTRSVDDPAMGKYRRQDIFTEMRNAIIRDPLATPAKASSYNNHYVYPFGMGHNVKFVHDDKNEYDKKAIKMILESANDLPLRQWHGRDLGYVPACLVPFIFENRDLMPSAKIKTYDDSIRDNKGRAYINLEIAVQLGDTPQFKKHAFDQSRLRFGALQ